LGRPEEKRRLGRSRHRREDNFKMYLQEMEWGGMNWILKGSEHGEVAAFVNAVMNFQVSLNAGNFLTS